MSNNTGNDEYKALAVKVSLWAQRHGIPGASPAILTKLARMIAQRRNPAMVEKFIRQYNINYTQASKCSANNTARSCAVKYGSLNDFFTRQIRGITIDNSPIVSPATCKCMLFDTFESSRIWVKGRLWSASRLLRKPATFEDYAVGIFRLRPADYHRFHVPISGVITSIQHIQGGYLSVDPAVVTKRDVFTENNRVVVSIDSAYGQYEFVAIGAAGVGKVVIFAKEGDAVNAGDMLGAFEFGGSTTVVLVPNPNQGVVWDQTIARNSSEGQETYVQVGNAVSA